MPAPHNAPNAESSELAAPRETLRSLANAFRRRSDEPAVVDWLYIVGGAVGVLAVLWFVARRVLRSEPPKPFRHPTKMFRSLCKAHRLSRRRRRLLERLALAHGLASPGLLFVMPAKLDVRGLDASWQRRQGELDLIKSRLFGA